MCHYALVTQGADRRLAQAAGLSKAGGLAAKSCGLFCDLFAVSVASLTIWLTVGFARWQIPGPLVIGQGRQLLHAA